MADVVVGGLGILLQPGQDRHQDTRRAEAALQAVGLLKGGLQGVQGAIGLGQAFDRAELGAVGLHREKQASAHRLTIHQDGAGTTDTVLTAHMGAGEAEVVAQEVGQQQPRFDGSLVGLSVDLQRDLTRALSGGLGHCGGGPPRLADGRNGFRGSL